MKTVLLTGIREMVIADTPDPVLQDDSQVLLRIEAVGVCGSDVHYYRSGRIGNRIVEYPFAVGHEAAATVVEVGAAVKDLAVGDRVAVEPAVSCGECDQCRDGRPHTCRNLKFLGCPDELPGCLSEYYVMPAECCFKIGDMSFELAALVEPLAIGCYTVQQSIPLAGARIGVLGVGPIGMCVMAAANLAGAKAVYVSEPIAARRELAAAHGATWCGDPSDGLVEQITAQEPQLLDAVYECCGKQEALDQAVRLLEPGGKLMAVGIPEEMRVSFEIDLTRRKEICIQNVRRQNGCVRAAIDLVAAHPEHFEYMITHRFGLAESQAAFELVDQYADGVLKAMILP